MAHFESMPEHSRMRDVLVRFPEKDAVLMGLGWSPARRSDLCTVRDPHLSYPSRSGIGGHRDQPDRMGA